MLTRQLIGLNCRFWLELLSACILFLRPENVCVLRRDHTEFVFCRSFVNPPHPPIVSRFCRRRRLAARASRATGARREPHPSEFYTGCYFRAGSRCCRYVRATSSPSAAAAKLSASTARTAARISPRKPGPAGDGDGGVPTTVGADRAVACEFEPRRRAGHAAARRPQPAAAAAAAAVSAAAAAAAATK